MINYNLRPFDSEAPCDCPPSTGLESPTLHGKDENRSSIHHEVEMGRPTFAFAPPRSIDIPTQNVCDKAIPNLYFPQSTFHNTQNNY